MIRDRGAKPHPHLGKLSAQQFLTDYWRQSPFFAPRAFAGLDDLVDADELAGAACESGVDARLVLGGDARLDWHAELGPFPESRFATLGPENWTLLVQAVDAWCRPVAGLTKAFDFLPRWCLDDVMVSYSVPGGGVGPHFDNYDVFLIQATGRRLWRTGQCCSAQTPLRLDSNLRLLQRFDEQHSFETGPGDLLYVPAGRAHWGTALTDGCITCSVGFRAPSHSEVIQQAAQLLVEDMTEDLRVSVGPEGCASDPFEIGAAMLKRLDALQASLTTDDLRAALARAVGALVTQPREDGLATSDESPEALVALPGDTDKSVVLREHARTAYVRTESGADLFVDGEIISTSLEFALDVCRRSARIEAAQSE
ncbi:MAG: cupin domain-containing protein [Chromatiales bacterium]|jgi:50S ribosomal protein L16 3-hydroxylase|nr:cupin domain-containing protein [Chromatiales bacterium]